MPTRGDRPLFEEQFYRMLDRQTVKPHEIFVVDFEPLSDDVDITMRYRIGYEKTKGKGYDCVLFMENDDYYAPNYIEEMLKGWVDSGCVDVFGTAYTTYYHVGIGRSFTFEHKNRSSMMSTLVKADLDLSWPADNYNYTDLHLWMHAKSRATFRPECGYICLGIKHGIGKCAAGFHNDSLRVYKDKGVSLKKIVGEDIGFYEQFKWSEDKIKEALKRR